MIAEYERQTDRRVRVFISSTFSDMQAERDVVVHSVFPRLREEFGRRMVDVTEVDLRWGIPEEESGDGRILEICIDEVLHCAPFFVGIVGKRYGTIASDAAVRSLPAKLKEALGKDVPGGLSITELEMRAGVFVPGNSAYSCFFVKRGAMKGSRTPPRIRDLVSTISARYETRPYSDLAGFEDALYESLRACIDRVFPERLDPPYGDAHYFEHLKILKSLASRYVPNEAFVARLERRLGETGCICLVGEKGRGKSACVSWMAKRAGVDGNENVFFHYAAAGTDSSDIGCVFRRLRLFLQALSGTVPETADDHAAVVGILSSGRIRERVFVFVDAVELVSDATALYKLFALRRINRNVHVLCSSVSRPPRLSNGQMALLGALEPPQVRRIMSETLRAYGKRLGKRYRLELERKRECSNPLFLRSVLQLLVMYANHDSFDSFFGTLRAATSFGRLFSIAIDGIKAYFGERGIDGTKVDEALALMVHSKRGVTESELLATTGMLPVAKSVLLLSLDLFTIESDGLIRFNHDLIVRAASEELERTGLDYRTWAATAFVRYFGSQPDGWRKYVELPYQLSRLQRTGELLALVCEPACFDCLARLDRHALSGYLSSLVGSQEEIGRRLFPKLDGEDRVRAVEILSAAGCHRAAISAAEETLGRELDPPTRIRLLDALARSQYKLGENRYATAIRTYRKLLSYFRSVHPDDEVGWASRAYLLGVTYKSAGRLDRSFSIFSDCEAIFRRSGVCSATSIWVMDVYGAACYAVGRIVDAEEAIRRAVSDCRYLFGAVSSELAWACCYGWPVFYAAGHVDRAMEMAREAHAICEQLYLGHGPMMAWAAENAGTAAMMQSLDRIAEERLLFSIRENDSVLPEESRPHVFSLTAYANLACLYERTGRHRQALDTIRFALSRSRAKNGAGHVYTANFMLLEGILAGNASEIKRAVSAYRKLGPGTPDSFFSRICLARVQAAAGLRKTAERTMAACSREYFSVKRETPLLTGLVLETCEALGVPPPDGAAPGEARPFPRIYITHNNNSQAIVIPEIGGRSP